MLLANINVKSYATMQFKLKFHRLANDMNQCWLRGLYHLKPIILIFIDHPWINVIGCPFLND